MSDRDELIDLISTARQKAVDAYWNSQNTCTLGQAGRVAQKCAQLGDQAAADAVLAAIKPRVIDQVDELLDLPACTVVREHGYGRIWEKADSEDARGDEWNLMGDDCSFRSWALVLPITVLYVPEVQP